MSDENVWLYINELTKKGKDYYTGLTHFIICEMHWRLNYRGDFPLVIYRTNKIIHVLQVDGDLFYPIEVQLGAAEYEGKKFDGYLMPMKEVLDFINTMFYEDMELELEEDEEGVQMEAYEDTREEFDIYYEGDNEEAFEIISDKLSKWDVILEEDIININK